MLKLIIAGLALTVATTALAASKKDLSQYDPKILLSRGGCGFGQVMGINGSCEPRAGMRQERRQERRHERRCAHRVGGVCLDKHDRDNGDMDE